MGTAVLLISLSGVDFSVSSDNRRLAIRFSYPKEETLLEFPGALPEAAINASEIKQASRPCIKAREASRENIRK